MTLDLETNCRSKKLSCATVECVRKQSEAKNLQDAARIQTEFMQKQMNSFGEQARSLGEAYIKAATIKATPFHMSTRVSASNSRSASY